MSVDADGFRTALAQFASGVTVVTTRDASGRPLGLTVSAFCSVSLEPPLVLVCLERRSEANTGIRQSGLFAVSILRENQEDLSRRFASRSPERFAGVELLDGLKRLPLVPGALAHLQCRAASVHEEGDHLVWVGEVLAASTRPGLPLLYHAGEYHRLPRRG